MLLSGQVSGQQAKEEVSQLVRGLGAVLEEKRASKSLQVINAGEGVEKREPSYTVGGNAN